MKTSVFDTESQTVKAAADKLASYLQTRPEACIAFSDDPEVYLILDSLAERYEKGLIFLSGCRFVFLSEYEMKDGFDQSVKSRVIERFIKHTDASISNCLFISEDNCNAYDDLVNESGGIDYLVMSIGVNGSAAYNEPGVQYHSTSHRQKLTDKNRQYLENKLGFYPEYVYTSGFQLIVSAEYICVVVSGADKAEAVHQMLYARTDSVIPAAFLQLPANVEVFADKTACSLL